MALADAQAHYDPIGGETTSYITPADAKNAIAQIYTDFVAADAAKANVTFVNQAMPIGAIIMWGSGTAPAGWHLCNGSVHGSAELLAAIGSANTPDLRDKFVVGAGTTYAVGATGGAASVTLSADESGTTAHTHGTSVATASANATHSHGGASGGMSANADHSHGGSAAWGGGHQHTYVKGNPTQDGYGLVGSAYHQGNVNVGATANTTYDSDGSHSHTIGGSNLAHTHSISSDNAAHSHTFTPETSNSAAAVAAHENRPPYYALTYIIRKS